MPELITSHSNPLVKMIRSLRQHKARTESGLFLVEGIHHVGEAIQAGWVIETLVYSPDLLTSEFGLKLVDDLSRRGIRCVSMTRDLFTDIAGKENPQGILAITHQRIQTLENFDREHFSWGAACVSPQDPGNVGAILRTIDAIGADGLFLLDDGVDLYHPSLVRASMGTLFWKPVVQASFTDFATWAYSHNIRLVGSSAHASVDYHAYKRTGQSMVLVLGNEQKGLSQDQLAACDLVLSLPMKGRISSLNLAVAAGILLYGLEYIN
jgi:RNA methyltransferase, TrmH family